MLKKISPKRHTISLLVLRVLASNMVLVWFFFHFNLLVIFKKFRKFKVDISNTHLVGFIFKICNLIQDLLGHLLLNFFSRIIHHLYSCTTPDNTSVRECVKNLTSEIIWHEYMLISEGRSHLKNLFFLRSS